jgi:hypothetical protein
LEVVHALPASALEAVRCTHGFACRGVGLRGENW